MLKQTVAVLRSLISSSGNFEVCLELISNAEGVCEGELLQGLEISQAFLKELELISEEVALKLETECVRVVEC